MASIRRFGRAISSGKTVSDNSFLSKASVSSAVRSSRFAKSDSAVPVVIKNSSRSGWPGQSVMAQPSSIPPGRPQNRWEIRNYGAGRPVLGGCPEHFGPRWKPTVVDKASALLTSPLSSSKPYPLAGYAPTQPEPPILRLARNLLLIVVAVLLLPYLLAPLYRLGHPVSTLMAWRWVTGAPVARQWVDFSAISPFLPRAVVAAEDAKFCNHHGIDWGALREVIDDAEDGEV